MNLNGYSGLGGFKPNTGLSWDRIRLAKVTSTVDLNTLGKIEVEYERGGTPTLVHFTEYVSVEPQQGDWVLVGNIEGQKNNVFFAGFFRNFYACSNYIKVTKDVIRFQLPIDVDDIKDRMKTDDKKDTRAYIEIGKDAIVLHHPAGGTVTLNADFLATLSGIVDFSKGGG